MHNIVISVGYLLLGITSGLTALANAQPTGGISLYAHQQKPFQYLNHEGHINGFAIELVRTLFAQANIPIKHNRIEMRPFARAYKTVLRQPNSAFFMAVRKEKREALFQWVGPLAPREKWLYKLSTNQKISTASLEEAKKLRIGTVYQSSTHDFLKRSGFQSINALADESLIFGMFMAKRIDLMPSLELSMAYKLKERGIKYNAVEKVVALDKRHQYYLAFSKDTPDNIISALQQALDNFKRSGAYQMLWSKYL